MTIMSIISVSRPNHKFAPTCGFCVSLLLAACGSSTSTRLDGGPPIQDDSGETTPDADRPAPGRDAASFDESTPTVDSASADLAPSKDARLAAVNRVLAQEPLCLNLGAFYWEIGDQNGALASGTGGIGAPPLPSDAMAIASASKLIFGVYMMERHAGALTADEITSLTFQSGHTNFDNCGVLQSVDECLAAAGRNGGTNGDVVAATVDHFFYNGGHMQQLASSLGLGADRNVKLASDLKTVLGATMAFTYTQPQLAGGVRTSAQDYAVFLRHLLDGTYPHALGLLGTHSVCTHPGADCPTALYSPVNQSNVPNPPAATPNDISDERWHYSLGHWVEDDPAIGDGAFSSPGAFGFYPWIDADKTTYGLLARVDIANAGSSDLSKISSISSVRCGRLVRKAWLTGK
jgi:hypothetical protein